MYPSNVDIPITREEIFDRILAGQAFSASFEQGSAPADGAYPICIFNPANSGKIAIAFSIQTLQAFVPGNIFGYYNTTDPAYANTVTPLNLDMGSPNISAMSVTAKSSAGISYPALNTRFLYTNNVLESLSNGRVIKVTPGRGLLLLTYAPNTQQYAQNVSWIEI